MKTDPKKLFTAKIGKACIDLHARKSTPSHTESVIMAAVVEYGRSAGMPIPALPPLKWEETRSFQSSKCPLTSDTYNLWASLDGWGCQMTPAKGYTVTSLGANLERPDAIAAIEQHRNQNLQKKLGL